MSHENDGFNPTIPDEVVSKWLYAGHFAMGAICGTACERDTIAWLAGNLTVGAGSSVIPVYGWLVGGGVADLRDAVASSIKTEYVSAAFALAGIIPYAGDTASATAKFVRFAAKNPRKIANLGPLIAKLPISRSSQITLMKIGVSGSWDSLRAVGISDDVLWDMRKSRFDINNAGHIVSAGKTAPFPGLEIPQGKLQHMFKLQPDGSRHSQDFGIDSPNQNNTLLAQLEVNIRAHVDDPATLHIDGLYKGKASFLHFNPQTSRVVIQTKDTGSLDSGWKPGKEQLHNTLGLAQLRVHDRISCAF